MIKHITKTQAKERTLEMLENISKWAPEKIDNVLNSVAVDLDDWEDNYYLPKLLLRALALEIDNQYRGLESNNRRDNKAIKIFFNHM